MGDKINILFLGGAKRVSVAEAFVAAGKKPGKKQNCLILPGVTIGENNIVATNSLVTKDVPDFTLVG